MLKNQTEFEVLVNGKPLKEYSHEGKTFIEGREDTCFSIRMRNNTGRRKLFIPSIDGLSITNGEKASFDSSGYVVKPYSAVTIDGWRISDSHVNSFFFTKPKDAYATKTKNSDNLGVIGCVVFDEKERSTLSWVTYPVDIFFNGTATLNISNQVNAFNSISQDLGTGWGETKRSEVTSVEFEKESYATAVFEIFYNTREQLERLGVDLRKETIYIAPQAFPGQYCKPPKD